MSYTPVSIDVYVAAFSGCISGILGRRFITDTNALDYDHVNAIAGAYAQEFDTLFATAVPNALQLEVIENTSTAFWLDRLPQDRNVINATALGLPVAPDPVDPLTYAVPCGAIIALVRSAGSYFTSTIPTGIPVPTPAPTGLSLYFDTAAVAPPVGGKKLKDVSAAYLAQCIGGVTVVWTQSLLDQWYWSSTSTLTADDITIINPTSNGINPGRFIRRLIASLEWRKRTGWFISTAGNNENSGASSLAPIADDIELGRRLGQAAILTAPTVVNYAQAPTGTSNYDILLDTNTSLTLNGTSTATKTGIVLTAVTAQNRAAQTAWAITGPTLGAADVGQLAIITNSGTPARIGAYAMILKDNGAGSVRIGPMVKMTIGAFAPTAVTPAAGDTISVVTPMTLKPGCIRICNMNQTVPSFGAVPILNTFVIDSIKLDGNSNNFGPGELYIEGVYAEYVRCIFKDVTLSGLTNTSISGQNLAGGGAIGAIDIVMDGVFFSKVGSLNATVNVRVGAIFSCDTDCYFQNSILGVLPQSNVSTLGVAFFDRTVSGALFISPKGHYQQAGSVADWGTNNTGYGIRVQSGGEYIYAAKPTVNSGLGPGRETSIGGTDKQYAAIPYVEATNNAMMVALA